jgi:hypothetical protein
MSVLGGFLTGLTRFTRWHFDCLGYELSAESRTHLARTGRANVTS